MSLLSSIQQRISRFCDTVRAGYYTPITRKSLKDDSDDIALPKKPGIVASFFGLSAAWLGITDIVIGAAVTASVAAVAISSAAIVATAAIAMGAIYLKCRHKAAQKIREINMAGQTVEGSRADLYALHNTQKKIVSLTMSFNEAACPDIVREQVNDLITDTKPVRDRIRVVNPGHTSHETDYDFVRPVVTLTDAMPVTGRKNHHRHKHYA